MLKRICSIMLSAVMAFGLMASVHASDTIKGVNQNGFNAVVPIDVIASYKHVDGKLYYRHQFSMTEYHIVDSGATQLSVLQTKLTGNYAANAYDGWTYVLRKNQITCSQTGGYTTIFPLGQTQSWSQNDGCQFWQTANGT